MKYIVLAALGAAVTGFLLGWVICRRGLDGISRAQAASVTRQLFVVTLWACIAWISCSYAMAIYSMVILGQVYTLTELSEPALKALTVTLGGKVPTSLSITTTNFSGQASARPMQKEEFEHGF